MSDRDLSDISVRRENQGGDAHGKWCAILVVISVLLRRRGDCYSGSGDDAVLSFFEGMVNVKIGKVAGIKTSRYASGVKFLSGVYSEYGVGDVDGKLVPPVVVDISCVDYRFADECLFLRRGFNHQPKYEVAGRYVVGPDVDDRKIRRRFADGVLAATREEGEQ